MRVAFTHIGINKQYLFSLSEKLQPKFELTKVFPALGLAPESSVHYCFHHGEMKAGTQTANSFNCQIRRVINRQEALNFFSRLSPSFFCTTLLENVSAIGILA
jgi:hypothetical protein